MIALLAEPALMNVPLKQLVKEIFIKLILIFAPIVVPVQMSARWKQFIQQNKNENKSPASGTFLFEFLP